MLPVVFEEFAMVYIFLLYLSSSHYHYRLLKDQLQQKSEGEGGLKPLSLTHPTPILWVMQLLRMAKYKMHFESLGAYQMSIIFVI